MRDDTSKVPTGIPTLDKYLRGGFRLGHVTMLLGRTGVGKTSVAIQVSVNVARAGLGVAFASLEMGREEVALRALSALRAEGLDQVEGELRDAPAADLFDLSRVLPLFSVDDSNKPDWDDLSLWVQRQSEVFSQPVSLVVVDHLKLMRRYGYPRGEAERVQQLAEDAKAFAKESRIALVMLHQTGRANEAAEGKEKDHGHLPLSMESAMYGGEQDSDYILGVYRPELAAGLDAAARLSVEGRMYLQLLKNRHGAALASPGVALRWDRPSFHLAEDEDVSEESYL